MTSARPKGETSAVLFGVVGATGPQANHQMDEDEIDGNPKSSTEATPLHQAIRQMSSGMSAVAQALGGDKSFNPLANKDPRFEE